MLAKVFYTNIGGKHRPYLEVFFVNSKIGKTSSKTFAMVDSGADHTIIPYSIGNSIAFEKPTEEEKPSIVRGVGGGSISYLERLCKIFLVNRSKNKIYVFNETVWWVYPNEEIQKEQNKLIEEYVQYQSLKSQSREKTDLEDYFSDRMETVITKLKQLQIKLEPNILLGRPFFDNFDFIQFCHKDRSKEDKCFFNYRVTKGKPSGIINLSGNNPKPTK